MTTLHCYFIHGKTACKRTSHLNLVRFKFPFGSSHWVMASTIFTKNENSSSTEKGLHFSCSDSQSYLTSLQTSSWYFKRGLERNSLNSSVICFSSVSSFWSSSSLENWSTFWCSSGQTARRCCRFRWLFVPWSYFCTESCDISLGMGCHLSVSPLGSCVLTAPAVECRSIPLINTRLTCRWSVVDTRSTCRSTISRHVSRQSVDSQWTESYFSQTLHRVSIDTNGDHTFNVGRHNDRYLMVGCRQYVGRLSMIYR